MVWEAAERLAHLGIGGGQEAWTGSSKRAQSPSSHPVWLFIRAADRLSGLEVMRLWVGKDLLLD